MNTQPKCSVGWLVEFDLYLFFSKFACKPHKILWVISTSARRTTDRVRMMRTVDDSGPTWQEFTAAVDLDGHVRWLHKIWPICNLRIELPSARVHGIPVYWPEIEVKWQERHQMILFHVPITISDLLAT